MDLRNADQGRYKLFTRRAALVAGGQSLLFAALAGRLYYLQVLEADRYATLAGDNRINLRLLPPPRGRIFDRLGTEIAINERNYRVVLVAERAGDVAETLSALGDIVSISEDDHKRIRKELRRKRAFVPVTVRDNLSWEEVSRIELNAPDLPGAGIEIGQVRHYPHGPAISQVLGYVAPVSENELTDDPLLHQPGFRIGKSGVEKTYDLDLRGAAGRSHVEVNAFGRIMQEVEREEATPGKDMMLTIDADLQQYVYERLSSERSASCVVMDIHSGEVFALASWPGYDPNEFHVGISSKRWRALTTDPLSPLANKALTGLYAPGSTFKLLVALAALEAGISPEERFVCRNEWRLGRALFHCWKKKPGHGAMDMRDAIKQSCDIYFYNVAKQLGIDRIADMAFRFGLGSPNGVDLPNERSGLIPTRAWKLGAIGERWQGGETVITAIGQGFVLTTPLQLATMTARLANGGFAVTPHVMRAAVPDPVMQPEGEDAEPVSPYGYPSMGIPQHHLEQVMEAMDAVVNEWRGTAFGKRIEEEGMEMAGKTGTSQVRRITLKERKSGIIKNEDRPWRFRDHALFVCYAPVHKPQYACAVVVEHGGGGSKVAAPIAHDILLETQKRNPAGLVTPDIADAPTPQQKPKEKSG